MKLFVDTSVVELLLRLEWTTFVLSVKSKEKWKRYGTVILKKDESKCASHAKFKSSFI